MEDFGIEENFKLSESDEVTELLRSAQKLHKRREAYLDNIMSTVAPVVKSWYLRTGVSFLRDKQLKEEEEEILAEFTDYCTNILDSITKRAIRLKNRDSFEKLQV